MSSTYTVLHDPHGLIEAELPLDRAPHEALVTAVLAWNNDPDLAPRDYEQIALQLAGAARAVSGDVRRAAGGLPGEDPARGPADRVLRETEQHLSAGLEGSMHCVQDRARLVRALYECLDRLADTTRTEPDAATGNAVR
ncbi:DUF6415 family natural product biosynthesis protein [Streptomyces sp. NPDC020875]|uniref:DUF6415 family natural product biosynthesis protein n=1 Tax=Streptomyces sp. NPDC020875 TaxID=3154898 RepID=UPI0034060196